MSRETLNLVWESENGGSIINEFLCWGWVFTQRHPRKHEALFTQGLGDWKDKLHVPQEEGYGGEAVNFCALFSSPQQRQCFHSLRWLYSQPASSFNSATSHHKQKDKWIWRHSNERWGNRFLREQKNRYDSKKKERKRMETIVKWKGNETRDYEPVSDWLTMFLT